ncbi:hypothetical protein Thiowin_03948 [Thiorhodovibrio winogradskyi]|uniref:DUF5615 domain-containing protein n=1 Tax=Thiorhodovibrio winogradskyi TaxID=77007 RepID=A0ABZ0SD85_9GAMM|nr:DUF5615 family PIN-like protein [Thiorhodovibrio winogradskyi]
MKLLLDLLDMNIPEVWEPYLRKAGHEAIHWSRIGDIRAEDAVIMDWARQHEHIILTHDLDFGALLYLTKARAPSVLQIRAEHIIPRVMGESVPTALESAKIALDAGALVTIDPRRHRVRVLPLPGQADSNTATEGVIETRDKGVGI